MKAIHEQTNTRIYERNIPSQYLQPSIDSRPASSKYTYFPVLEEHQKPTVPIYIAPTFHTQTVFNPGNTQSPWSGYNNAVNIESGLRQQTYALQSCPQSVYVPSSTSDLYNYTFEQPKPKIQTHNLLFETQTFSNFDPNPNKDKIGNNLFFNSTRTQLRDA